MEIITTIITHGSFFQFFLQNIDCSQGYFFVTQEPFQYAHLLPESDMYLSIISPPELPIIQIFFPLEGKKENRTIIRSKIQIQLGIQQCVTMCSKKYEYEWRTR